MADQDAYAADADAVTLITLHAAKGLEFDVVFIAGLEEGVFPHTRALDDPRQMEEERRLAYVGLTRARHRLYLTHAAQRATWGRGGFSVPSRFLLEIPAELMHGPRLVVVDDGATTTSGPPTSGRAAARPRPGPRAPCGRPTAGARAPAGRSDRARCRRAAATSGAARARRGRARRSGHPRPGRQARGVLRLARLAGSAMRADVPDSDGAAPAMTARRTPAGARRWPRVRGAAAAARRRYGVRAAAARRARRAALPRRRPRPAPRLRRGPGRLLEADPRRRGGHRRLPGHGVKKLLASLANLEVLEPR